MASCLSVLWANGTLTREWEMASHVIMFCDSCHSVFCPFSELYNGEKFCFSFVWQPSSNHVSTYYNTTECDVHDVYFARWRYTKRQINRRFVLTFPLPSPPPHRTYVVILILQIYTKWQFKYSLHICTSLYCEIIDFVLIFISPFIIKKKKNHKQNTDLIKTSKIFQSFLQRPTKQWKFTNP